MSIELNENTVGVWFASDGMQDVMFHLGTEADVSTLTYRFREYVDDKLGNDSEDVKHWYTVTCDLKKTPKGEQNLIDTVEAMITSLESTFGDIVVHKVFMDGNGFDDFAERFAALPCMHSQEVTQEEYEAEYGKPN